MAVQQVQNLPAQFVQDLGQDLAKQVVAQTGVPVVTQGLGALQQAAQTAGLPLEKQTFETQEQFDERKGLFDAQQRAALGFDQRQLALQGIRPTVAGQDPLQQEAQKIAEAGIGTFQPFLDRAEEQAKLAGGLGTLAFGQLAGVGTGPITAQQLSTIDRDKDSPTFGQTITPTLAAGSFMSPFQSQVIDATLAEFDRNKAIQEQSIRDQQAALGVLGAGRAGVQLAEFGTGAARERALLQAGLLQQGFGQAQAARQQDIANRFGLAQATQGLGAFQSGLAGQQAALGGQQQALTGGDVRQLGTLGALNQAQAQAVADANREAARQAAFLPQEQLDRFAAQVTGIMGGYPGQTQQTVTPNPTPLQTALGVGTTLAGIYGAINNPAGLNLSLPKIG